MGDIRCGGDHHYFVAETVGVESEGAVTVIAICTSCGNVVSQTVSVSSYKGQSLKLASLEEVKEKTKGATN